MVEFRQFFYYDGERSEHFYHIRKEVYLMEPLLDIRNCHLCPRNCGVNREETPGTCGQKNKLRAARAALHHWEEPCISGTRGSGAVFFSGCTLKCCFCQNYKISQGDVGKEITVQRLADIFLSLQEQGAHNLNLVTPTQFLPWILPALEAVRPQLHIPVVYNCGGYEKPEIISLLKDQVDIYLPDLKYHDPRLSLRYSGAKDYFQIASQAIPAMIQQTGPPVFDGEGLMKKGVLIRHMVLPGCRKDSSSILNWLCDSLPKDSFLLSLLSQYTPFYKSCRYPEIDRRLTTYEYDRVLEEALDLGLTRGFMQERSSAKEEYTPPFDLEGL